MTRPATDHWTVWADRAVAARGQQRQFNAAARAFMEQAQGRRGEQYDYWVDLYNLEISKAQAAARWASYCDTVSADVREAAARQALDVEVARDMNAGAA